ncbi:MAG: hypothetical protein KAI24_18125, partial [Planctomycetes bacterium]|nr:hypothetical protein [Planctomycetota bacterium]
GSAGSRTSKGSLDQIRDVYSRLKAEKRLHVPGQVAREYTRWRARKLTDLYQRLADLRGKAVKPSQEDFPILEGAESYVAFQEMQAKLGEAVSQFRSAVDKVLAEIRGWSLEDPVTRLYRDVVGAGAVRDLVFDGAELREELRSRFRHQIPPGYKDAAKVDSGVGDLLIWKTILEIGRERKKHLIFVTGEEKADWQHRADNRGLFPRLELVDEYRRASEGQTFHLVSLSHLLELMDADAAAVAEVRQQEAVARERVELDVSCPNCEAVVSCLIRPVPGASAKPVCAECRQWFHAHWREDGDPIVRRPRETAASRPVRVPELVECPECNAQVAVEIAAHPGASAIPRCGGCSVRFHVHRHGDGALSSQRWGARASAPESDANDSEVGQ